MNAIVARLFEMNAIVARLFQMIDAMDGWLLLGCLRREIFFWTFSLAFYISSIVAKVLLYGYKRRSRMRLSDWHDIIGSTCFTFQINFKLFYFPNKVQVVSPHAMDLANFYKGIFRTQSSIYKRAFLRK